MQKLFNSALFLFAVLIGSRAYATSPDVVLTTSESNSVLRKISKALPLTVVGSASERSALFGVLPLLLGDNSEAGKVADIVSSFSTPGAGDSTTYEFEIANDNMSAGDIENGGESAPRNVLRATLSNTGGTLKALTFISKAAQ